MRVRLMLIMSLFVILSSFISAHGQKSVSEKVSNALAKFDAVIKPDKAKRSSIETIFTDFYTAHEKLRSNIQGAASDNRQPLQQDYQSIRKQNESLFADRDNRLKKVLSTEEFKKWKDEIEPSLRKK
ncbi:hypothetical protein A8C56_19730 [Niabella ginsenosidivorans]|uniref:Uncharacterized protein n=1 Tax=Niabella ginsenosidivorans TaxID=1176587 RepID=A0A1A9I5F3_9BACT|nr:hypothetical protein [Niabella ginsenosidivorans]ANH82917.1 hypothetical protein A8C56_19730 [Niabella ginsenosidivorans]